MTGEGTPGQELLQDVLVSSRNGKWEPLSVHFIWKLEAIKFH